MSGHGGRGAVARSRRRRGGAAEHGEEGGAERWLVTYADMLTLLLVLFIVLYSVSVVNTSKFLQLSSSLASAFGSGHTSVLDGGSSLLNTGADPQGHNIVDNSPVDITANPPASTSIDPANPQAAANTPTSTPAKPQTTQAQEAQVLKEIEDFHKIKKAINAALAQKHMTGAVQFQVDKRGLIIRVWTNAVIFGGNSATLLDGGKNVLNVIAPELKNDPHNIEVDGYTNQLPSGTGPFASGWELSGDRAAAVVRYLIGRGVSYTKHHMRATGMNDQNPLLPPSDPRSVSRNRRVEIVVLTSLSTTQAAELPAADRQTTTH